MRVSIREHTPRVMGFDFIGKCSQNRVLIQRERLASVASQSRRNVPASGILTYFRQHCPAGSLRVRTNK